MSTQTLELRLLTVEETFELRRRVMRDGQADAVVELDVDALPGAWHAGAVRGGLVVGTASFYPIPCPLRAEVRPVSQLRMMAVDAGEQGRGTGRLLLQHAIDRLRAAGVRLLWCNARDSATGFYERLGFSVEGDGFITPVTRLPHHVMLLDL